MIGGRGVEKEKDATVKVSATGVRERREGGLQKGGQAGEERVRGGEEGGVLWPDKRLTLEATHA